MTTFGLADLRGGLHAGFDEGAWITTAFGIGQMVAGVCSPYLGAIFGVRRVLLLGIVLVFTTSLLGPLSPNLDTFLIMQFMGGVGSGTFIPLTISFIIRSLPASLVVYGIALYAMNSELSQNVSASLEGWWSDNLSWQWIDWQYCLVLPVMFACIWDGVPREKINTALMRDLDWPGIIYAMIGFGLLYAGLDQGNRLGWSTSGLVMGLLLSGSLITLAFVARELIISRPFLNLGRLLRGNLLLLMLALAGFRFIILSTAYIIPTYLQTVQNFRELQVGSVLLWIALPQLVTRTAAGSLLKRIDARWVLALGSALIGIACLVGDQPDQPVGHRRFPAIADPAGHRPVLRADRAADADHPHDQPGRRAGDRLLAADQPPVRRRDRHRLHADLRADPRADPLRTWSGCTSMSIAA